jgi:hypothetical protein
MESQGWWGSADVYYMSKAVRHMGEDNEILCNALEKLNEVRP